ncbi:MAG: ROK family protein [Cyanobacteria bacterium P01_F01_bin.33]
MSSAFAIGIDVGGTAIKVGSFDREGRCLGSLKISTPQPSKPQTVLHQLVDLVQQLDPKGHCVAIGVGVPGPSDADCRIALRSINLPGWVQIPVADELEQLLHKPVVVENDANCAGVGEAWLGAGQACHSMILLTLGTGVGGAIVLNGELFSGSYGAAGELGLVVLYPDGPPCNSGNNGSLEQYVSATAIARRTGMGVRELDRRARAGDATALEWWHRIGTDLGAGLSSSIYVLAPEVVAIGGGVSQSADLFLPAAIAEIERRVMPTSRMGLRVVPAQLGNQAGCVGAARLAWQHGDRCSSS